MQPRSCFSPFLSLFMVTKTPHGSNSFLGVFSGGGSCVLVCRYSLTAFRASSIRNFPSSILSSNDKSGSPYYEASAFPRSWAVNFEGCLEMADLEFNCFFSYAFLGYYQEIDAVAAHCVSANG